MALKRRTTSARVGSGVFVVQVKALEAAMAAKQAEEARAQERAARQQRQKEQQAAAAAAAAGTSAAASKGQGMFTAAVSPVACHMVQVSTAWLMAKCLKPRIC